MVTGTFLANRYRIGERIGGGGMALVYRARDEQLGRDVAVKVLRGQFGTDEEFIRRFRREAQNAASLSHPNVVQIFDVGRDDDQYFIVMELVEGQTLKELIQRQGPLPIAEAVRISAEILGALEHAHTNRIVHRDIKPHNILISRDGHAKVTDFGIARATTTDTVTHTGSIMGSAHYFSPEQANGQPTGEKSDIYSMGIVLYEMLTGTVPFTGDSPITVALKHIRDRVVPATQLNSEVPVELDEIILRALEKEPEDRYPSAAAMRQALEQFAEDHAAGRTHMPSGDFPTMDL
ncbi:MAG TPA: Stk1 family PASTA domain-containing Ser/Thr kinase, partial [Symbiobacteriaceae bacterium]|nr:Stk1 family PASTA domain-containing Ser/Thr kinase [Symbiobacteriaceae bacterium]